MKNILKEFEERFPTSDRVVTEDYGMRFKKDFIICLKEDLEAFLIKSLKSYALSRVPEKSDHPECDSPPGEGCRNCDSDDGYNSCREEMIKNITDEQNN